MVRPRRRPPPRTITTTGRTPQPVDESYGGIEWTNEFEGMEGVEPQAETEVQVDNDEETNYESAEETGSTDTASINDNNIDINYNDENNDNEINEVNNETANDDNDINNIDIDINVDNNVNSRRRNNNIVTVETCRDNIVSANTLASYLSETIKLFKYALVHHPEWFTAYGKRSVIDLLTQKEDETATMFRERKTNTIALLVRNATTNPLLYMERITPHDYMKYLVGIKKIVVKRFYPQVRTGTNVRLCSTCFEFTIEAGIQRPLNAN
jgi:hypothetical protein